MIDGRYTLFTRIPAAILPDGQVATDPLWVRDLVLHLDYIPDFRLCCPVVPESPFGSDMATVPGLSANRVVALRRDGGHLSALANLVPNFLACLAAVRQSDVVHTSGAGWSFPLAYYMLPLRPFLRFAWVMVIESSFWMAPSEGAGLRRRLAHRLNLALIRRCLAAADARIFTQPWYRDTFLGSEERTLIAPAVWIEEQDLVSEADLGAVQAARSGPVRLVFPARLVNDKGVEIVLAAVERYEDLPEAPPVELDIIGTGPLLDRCRTFASGHQGRVTLRVLDPVPYGTPFLSLLRGYDAVVIANRQAEQPRIVFDAGSQGLPCIATRTTGVTSLVEEDRTALLFDIDDPAGLALVMRQAAMDRDGLARMGRRALGAIAGQTHRAMHEEREAFLKATLPPPAGRVISG